MAFSKTQVKEIYNSSLIELLYRGQNVMRDNFKAGDLQMSTLCSIKTGGCPEDCGYCAQSGHYQKKTGLKREALLSVEEVKKRCQEAKNRGADRFCIAAAWRRPPAKEFTQVLAMVKEIKHIGLEACATLGMLTPEESHQLKEAGLDYYNHNLDTSPKHYLKIVSTHEYSDRLKTISHVIDAGIKVCCGGIVGLGEEQDDRIELLCQLAKLQPQSVPINQLVAVPGTPLENTKPLEGTEFLRTIATARIIIPKAWVRISAGRETMSKELQLLCFMAGANSIFLGDTLLTVPNSQYSDDKKLLDDIGLMNKLA